MGLDVRKPVFGVSDKARLKPVSSDTETSWNNEISLEASKYMILSSKRIIKALNSLRRLVCAFVVPKPLKTSVLAPRPI